MKGIILAGGSGTRLHPMTLAASKQLLPVYDKPMVYYPLSTLMLAGIREILVISTPEDLPQFRRLLGDGSRFGVRFAYAVQPQPGRHRPGLPDRPRLDRAARPARWRSATTDLRRPSVRHCCSGAAARPQGATVFAYQVRDPERYGVVAFDADGRALEIVEKPAAPQSQLGGDRALFLRRARDRYRRRDPALGARRAGDHRPQPGLSRGGHARTSSGCRAAAPGSTPARRTACCRRRPSCRPSSRARACWSAARRRSRSAWASSTPTCCARHASGLGKTELGRVLMELAEGEHA